MPELPEVETIKRRLKEVIPGKRVAKVAVLREKSFSGDLNQLLNHEIVDVTRRAKILNFHLDNNFHLLTHLKMTGQLIYVGGKHRIGGGHPTADWIHQLPGKHTRIQYTFTDNSQLFFNDMRVFGWMRLVDRQEAERLESLLGPDVNSPDFTLDDFQAKLARRSQPIKVVIMDGAVVSGLGNIYACDTLNLARLSPFRPAKSLTANEVKTLYQAARVIIAKGIDLGGTTFDGKYLDIHGLAGQYQDEALTYGREGQPCYNCGAPIKKVKLAGRGTYYCEVCQQ